mgnify:CR=1 FL=1
MILVIACVPIYIAICGLERIDVDCCASCRNTCSNTTNSYVNCFFRLFVNGAYLVANIELCLNLCHICILNCGQLVRLAVSLNYIS